uniref:Ig-like domain-containing protein n=1 Tax=Labrus bergylta TaxID=56723 RepID=A0A3Q3E121_9LABR
MFDITFRNRIWGIKHPSSLPYCSLFYCSLQNYGHFKGTVIRTTMNKVLIKAFLLCSLSWISVSGSESQTVEVQSGEDVTLMCSGMDKHVSVRYWLKLVKGTDIQCVSTMTSYNSEVTYHDGFSNHTFTMSSNTSTIFLKVRSVELNDSGIYYCGFNKDGRPFFTTIHLKIKDEDMDRTDCNLTKCDGAATLVSMILGALTLLLVMVVIGLGAKIRKLQTAAEERQNPGHTEVNTTQFTLTQFNVTSDELNYAAVTFRSKAKRRGPEPNVLYAATR